MTQKICTRCEIPKDLDCFDLHARGRYGRHSRCKICRGKYEATRFKLLPENRKEQKREKQRNTDRFRLRGISREEFNAQVVKQAGLCWICKQYFGNRLCIDHNHTTEKVRGLLCTHCNLGIGLLQENVTILMNAIEYLKLFDGTNEN